MRIIAVVLALCWCLLFLATHDFQPSAVDSRGDYYESLKGGK